jgi:heme A synthase
MLSLHGRLATVLVLYYVLVGLWGIVLGIRNSGPTPAYRGAIVIATVAVVAQGVIGILVFALLRPPRETLHVLYGFALVLAMPLAATVVRDRQPRGQSIALGLASLFAAGLAIRGITTA